MATSSIDLGILTSRKRKRSTASSSFFLLLFVNAKCTVHDPNGKRIELSQLPTNQVEYKSTTDTLECLTEESCRHWIITGCAAVYCRDRHACQGTQFIGNDGIACWGPAACEHARFRQAKDISCGAGFADTCRNVVIDETDAQVLCYGPGACVTPLGQVPMLVNVGAQGHVRCASGADDGVSCQNLLVGVRHGSRACIEVDHGERASPPPNGCSVICTDDQDCDTRSIKFRVQ
ncbi:hypothetical protein ACA910_011207 [Epithemia clementina (nom. ined.)]